MSTLSKSDVGIASSPDVGQIVKNGKLIPPPKPSDSSPRTPVARVAIVEGDSSSSEEPPRRSGTKRGRIQPIPPPPISTSKKLFANVQRPTATPTMITPRNPLPSSKKRSAALSTPPPSTRQKVADVGLQHRSSNVDSPSVHNTRQTQSATPQLDSIRRLNYEVAQKAQTIRELQRDLASANQYQADARKLADSTSKAMGLLEHELECQRRKNHELDETIKNRVGDIAFLNQAHHKTISDMAKQQDDRVASLNAWSRQVEEEKRIMEFDLTKQISERDSLLKVAEAKLESMDVALQKAEEGQKQGVLNLDRFFQLSMRGT